MSLYDKRWHNRLGVRVGMPVQEVRRRFPAARFEKMGGSAWLVLRRRREQELNFITLTVRVDRSGRVLSIEVPAAYVY